MFWVHFYYWFWVITSIWQADLSFKVHMFWSELPFLKIAQFLAVKRFTANESERQLKSKRQKQRKKEEKKRWQKKRKEWQSLELREICDVWQHKPGARLCFVIQRVKKNQRWEEKSTVCEWFSIRGENIWGFLQGQRCNLWVCTEVTSSCFMGLFVLPLSFWQAYGVCPHLCLCACLCELAPQGKYHTEDKAKRFLKIHLKSNNTKGVCSLPVCCSFTQQHSDNTSHITHHHNTLSYS